VAGPTPARPLARLTHAGITESRPAIIVVLNTLIKLELDILALSVRKWLSRMKVKTLFIEPGSPWENGYIESFNGKLRDELLDGEIFYTLIEAQVLIERWRREYNWKRPHSSLGYRPPAPVAIEAAA
jgi:transposase InsO family protein